MAKKPRLAALSAFCVRVANETVNLTGDEVVDYVNQRLRNRGYDGSGLARVRAIILERRRLLPTPPAAEEAP